MFNTQQVLLSIIFSFIFTQMQSQVDSMSVKSNHKLIISISGGAAIPSGENTSIEKNIYSPATNIAGYATTGYNGKLELTYLPFKNLGLNCMIYSSVNSSLRPSYNELFPPVGIPAMGGGSNMLYYAYSTKKWYTSGVLLGPVIGIGINKIRIELKYSGGIQQVKSPETRLDQNGYTWQMNWTTTYPYNNSTTQPKLTSKNFVFDSGINIRTNFNTKLNAVISMDYLISRASFTGKTSYIYEGNNGTNNTHTEGTNAVHFVKRVSLFCLNAGLTYAIK